MAENLLTVEIAEINLFASQVSWCAERIRGLTTPGLDGCAAGAFGSDIAAACGGKQLECSTYRSRAASRLEQFESLCRQAGSNYLSTEEEIASGFDAMGQA